MAGNRTARRGFGSVRKLPSGKYQARYRGPDGITYTAPTTYAQKADADAFLATVHADIVRESWKAPRASGWAVDEYGRRWIAHRPGIKASTRARYDEVWNAHITEWVGGYALEDVTPDVVRSWHDGLTRELAQKAAKVDRSPTASRKDGRATVAHAYRVLRAVMATAVEDELIPANPCRIKGGGSYVHDERPTLSIPQVEELADTVPDKYRALVLVLAWCGLRLGEAVELRRGDIDLEEGTVRVSRAVYPVKGGYVVDTSKSRAGRRIVTLPTFVTGELRRHMARYTDLGPDALVFPTRSGRTAYGAAQTAISRAMRSMGLEGVRVHDLRHTGQTLAAREGATLADLMARLGHSTVNAAMRYAHAADDHGREVADRMDRQRAKVVRLQRKAGNR